MVIDGTLDDRELRQAIQDYLHDRYGVKVNPGTLRLDVVKEAEPLKTPAEYRASFRGEMRKQSVGQ